MVLATRLGSVFGGHGATQNALKPLEGAALKTIAAFLNSVTAERWCWVLLGTQVQRLAGIPLSNYPRVP